MMVFMSKTFKQSLISDLKDISAWKVKAIFFLMLTGMVMPWALFASHQISLGLKNRDISSFAAVSAVCSIIVPIISGVIGDQIGNFRILLAFIFVAFGLNTCLFTYIPSANSETCSRNILHITKNETNNVPLHINNDSYYEYFDNKTRHVAGTVQSLEYETVVNSTTVDNTCKSITYTYWIYMLARTCSVITSAMAYTLFDGAVVSMSKECKLDYGFQRAWGTLAALISSYLGGVLVDYQSLGKNRKDFSLMFYCAGISLCLAGLLVTRLDIQYRRPAKKISKDFFVISLRYSIISLLALALVTGIMFGFAETFMYAYLVSLGASGTTLGLTVTVGACLEIVLQICSGFIIKAVGTRPIFLFGFLCYALRFLGFSFLTNPGQAIALELFDAWGSGLIGTVINIRIGVLYPEVYVVSGRGLIGGLQSGIGKLISAQAGIEIVDYYGFRTSWRIMSGTATFVFLVYMSFYVIERLRKKSKSLSITT